MQHDDCTNNFPIECTVHFLDDLHEISFTSSFQWFSRSSPSSIKQETETPKIMFHSSNGDAIDPVF